MCVALSLLGYWAYAALDAHLYQSRGAEEIKKITSGGHNRADGASGARAAAAVHDPIGSVMIPRLSMSAIISEGVDNLTLLRAVGHVPGTPFPGEGGNSGLTAHRDSYFRALKDVRVGDLIRIETVDGSFQYAVDSIAVVGPERWDVLSPTVRPTLTLVTCYPFHYIGHAPKRFVVRAREIPDRG